jgi:hypothetical protein
VVDLRASDVDRQRVIDELQRHTTAGRLTLDELAERIGSVYGARTLTELAATTADLPAEPAEAPAPGETHGDRQLLVAFAIALAAIVLLAAAYIVLAH